MPRPETSPMDVMLLAAGRGKRMGALTADRPKPLIEVAGRPLIEHQLERLALAGFRRVVINLAYRGEQIAQALGDGDRFGLAIEYSREESDALSTAGGIRHALPLLHTPTLLVLNADLLIDADFARLRLPEGCAMHLLLAPNPAWRENGDFDLDTQDPPRIRMSEKRPYTFCGVGCYRRAVFAALPPGRLALRDLIRHHAALGEVSAELHQRAWLDVGTPERLQEAQAMLSRPSEGAADAPPTRAPDA